MPGTLKLTHDQLVMDKVGKQILYSIFVNVKMNADIMMANLFPEVKPWVHPSYLSKSVDWVQAIPFKHTPH